MSDWVSIGAMWKNEDNKIGLSFNADNITRQLKLSDLGSMVKVFSNDYKKEDKHPDYKLFIHREELQKMDITQEETPTSAPESTSVPEPETPPTEEEEGK